eukprot:PhF_6_TR27921/c0_g2_i1/m.41060
MTRTSIVNIIILCLVTLPASNSLRRDFDCPNRWLSHTPKSLAPIPTVHVNLLYGDDKECRWNTSYPCRSFATAIEIAPSGSRVILHSGAYSCTPKGIAITKSLQIIGMTDDVVAFQCDGKGRAMWFDNVYAYVENVDIYDGSAQYAGGILV